MRTVTPWLIVLGVMVLTVPALDRIVDFETLTPKFTVDPSIKALLPRDGEALKVFEETRDRYATDDYLLVAWIADDLYRPQRLANLKRLTRRIERLPGVDKVESLASAYNLQARGDITRIDEFLDELPKDRAGALRVRDEALANPLYVGHLLSRDGRGLLLAIHFDPALSSPTLIELVDRIAAASEQEANGVEQFLSGPLFVRLEVSRVMLRDLYRTMPIAVAATLLIAAVGFRSVRGVLLPLLSNTVALILALAWFVEAGHTMNFVTVILPPVIYVVGFAYAIHIVSDFDRHLDKGLARVTATKAALGDVFMPLTLTAFTTAAGFLSLAVSDIDSIRLFGLYAALGTILAWASALVVVPAGLMILPVQTGARVRRRLLSRLAPKLADFDLRHARGLLAVGAVLAGLSVAAASQIEVDTDYLRNFSEASPIRRNFHAIGRVFTGAVPLQILIETDIPETFKEPADLRTIVELKRWLEAQPEIGGVYTLADYVAVVHRALAPDVPTDDGVPRSASMTNHLLLLGGADDIYRFTDFDYQSTLLHVRSTAVSTHGLLALGARIEERLRALPPHMRGRVTGSSYLVARTIEDVTRGQVVSLALALGVIYLLLVVLFGSFRAGTLALIPNALPIVAYFGILGASSITLNLTTSLVASAVLGIAVDDSIHFLTRFGVEARRADDEKQGVVAALAAVIRPVSFTTAALCIGFFTLTTGELKSQIEFGLLAAATLFIAWLLDLTFTPALCGRMRFVTLWELLTLRIGRAPHKTIPVFAGLTNREARIAALIGEIATFEEVENSHDSRALEGAVVVGLDEQIVETPRPPRVLVLSADSLRQIRRRYPRIGKQIDRNLASADEYKNLGELH